MIFPRVFQILVSTTWHGDRSQGKILLFVHPATSDEALLICSSDVKHVQIHAHNVYGSLLVRTLVMFNLPAVSVTLTLEDHSKPKVWWNPRYSNVRSAVERAVSALRAISIYRCLIPSMLGWMNCIRPCLQALCQNNWWVSESSG